MNISSLRYFIVFITRYLDLFQHSQQPYLVFFKVTYILTSVLTLGLFAVLHSTWEPYKDTCNLSPIFVPSFCMAMLLTDEYTTIEVAFCSSQAILCIHVSYQYF